MRGPYLLLGLSWLMILLAAQAACTLTKEVPLAFGRLPSYTLRNETQSTSTHSAGLRCDTGERNMLRVSATVLSTDFRLTKEGGEFIPFIASATPDGHTPLTLGTAIDYLALYDPYHFPLYLRIQPGINASAGTYKGSLTIKWDWSTCTRPGTGGCSAQDHQFGISSLPISLEVSNDCQISVPTITFGAAAFPADFSPINSTLMVSCTNKTVYYVGMDGGNHLTGGRRQMIGSNRTHKLQYDIFNSQTNQLWTDTASGRVSAIGNGRHTPSQNLPFRVVIYADQPAQPADIYKDQVRVNIYF